MLPMMRGQQNTSNNMAAWTTSAPPTPAITSLPIVRFFGITPQPQPLPFYNQENLPFVVPASMWNAAWNVPPLSQTVPTQFTIGRPILGRRNEPNKQEPSVIGISGDGYSSQDVAADIEDTERGLKRTRPPSPLENWSQNNNQASRKCITPSYAVLGVNTSIPPPPIVNLPRKENEVYFNPISHPPCNPVELHVTNLDQSIDLREMKKLLVTAFREHVMVLHVSVFVQSDGTLAASVKVPSMQDAQYAISQLHRRKVGFKRIMIAHAHSTSPPNPQYIKTQIVSLLHEVPGNKMPLFTFRELFASRYLTSVSVSDLFRMRDVCIITEEKDKNYRTITLNPEYRNTPSPALSTEASSTAMDLPFCVRHSQQCSSSDKGWAEQEQPGLPNVRVPLGILAERVISLIESHDNWLPLASLMDCYSAQFEPLPVDEQGAPLEHLVTCINGVELVHSVTSKHLRLHPFKPAVNNRSEESSISCVSPSLINQVNLFARELVDLLKTQPHCQLLFNRFIPAYHHHFGRQCRVADYGFTKLIDLLETLPHVVQVMGESNKRVVTLSHQAQVRRFTSDLLRLLKAQTSKQVSISELGVVFERTLGRPLDPVDYGLCLLEDLLSQLSASTVVVSGSDLDLTIAIPRRDQTLDEIQRTKQFAHQVVELLSHTPQCSMEFAKFIPAYHHHYGTQCRVSDFGFTKLIELFEAIPEIVKIDEEEEGVRRVTLTLHNKIKVLENQMTELVLPRYPPGVQLESVHSAYLWQFGYALKPSIYGCSNITELVNKLSTTQITTASDGTCVITPVDHSESRLQHLRVLRVLWDQPSGQMSLNDFDQSFLQYYQQPCNHHIFDTELKDVVEVFEDIIQLTAIEQFARDVFMMLRSEESRIALNVFDATFHRRTGQPPTPACFGFPSTQSLLQRINHVVKITGHPPRCYVMLNPELAAVGILDLHEQKSGNYDNKELHTNTDSGCRSTSHSLLKEVHLKMSGDSAKMENAWSAAWNNKNFSSRPNGNVAQNCESYKQPTVVNMPEPRTPPSKEECMALLSPAKFLLPAFPFSFIPSSPDPSELPKPGYFNLTQVNNKDFKRRPTELVHDGVNINDQSKRRFRMAAHFNSPVPQSK